MREGVEGEQREHSGSAGREGEETAKAQEQLPRALTARAAVAVVTALLAVREWSS